MGPFGKTPVLAASAAILLFPAEGCSGGAGGGRRVEVVAHRGFSGAAPENTLAALRAAIDAGADRAEFDVLLTADGVPVVIHDAGLDRTTDGKGSVAARTLAEVGRLDAGGWFAARFRGERVPTLDAALLECKGRIAVNVEIKGEAVAPGRADSPGGIEAKVVEAIRRHGMTGSSVVSSFEPRALERVRRLAPEIVLQSLYREKEQRLLGPAAVCAEVGSRGFNCSVKEVTPDRVSEAHAAGLTINVYTADEPAEMRRLLELGADGIITNRPDRLLEVLGRADAACRRGR